MKTKIAQKMALAQTNGFFSAFRIPTSYRLPHTATHLWRDWICVSLCWNAATGNSAEPLNLVTVLWWSVTPLRQSTLLLMMHGVIAAVIPDRWWTIQLLTRINVLGGLNCQSETTEWVQNGETKPGHTSMMNLLLCRPRGSSSIGVEQSMERDSLYCEKRLNSRP